MKHAYAIVAFNNWEQLDKLITLIDDERNDIYIHVNINVKDCDFEHIKSVPKKSNIYILNRLDTEWGTDGLALVMLEFFKAATPKHYDYYHYISGACLPLKTQNEIHKFFEKNAGKEFVQFVSKPPISDNIYSRYKYYHYFKKYIRSNTFFKRVFIGTICENISIFIQKLLRVDRLKKYRNTLCYGSNWCSVTDELANFTLKYYDDILPAIKYTFAPDEMLMQTICYNSYFKDRLYNTNFDDDYHGCMRSIDWTRGNPYTYRISDFDELMNSDYLFARKFDQNQDSEIIDKIYETLTKYQEVDHDTRII